MRLVTQVFATKVVDYTLRFAGAVLMARYLGPSDKGVLTFAQLVVTWIVTFGNFSIYDANIFLLGSRRFSTAEVTASTFALSLLQGVVYTLALLGLVFFHWVNWTVGQPVVICILAWSIPLGMLLTNGPAILQGLNLFKAYNAFTILRSVSFLAGVLVVIGVTEQRLVGFAYAALITSFLNVLPLMVYLGRLAGWRLRISWPYLKEAFSYGLRGHLRVLLVLFTSMFDQFVVGGILAPAHLGLYSVAVSLSTGLLMLPDSVAMVLFPRVASEQASGTALTARACRCAMAVVAAAAAAGIVMGKSVITMLYGKQFLPAATPFYVLLVAVVFQTASRVLRNYFYGVGRPQLTLWSSGAAALVMATTIFPLIRGFGIAGAAASALLAHGVGAFVDLVVAVKLSDAPARHFLLPQKTDFRLAAWRP